MSRLTDQGVAELVRAAIADSALVGEYMRVRQIGMARRALLRVMIGLGELAEDLNKESDGES